MFALDRRRVHEEPTTGTQCNSVKSVRPAAHRTANILFNGPIRRLVFVNFGNVVNHAGLHANRRVKTELISIPQHVEQPEVIWLQRADGS